MTQTYGSPESKTDEELIEGLRFWRRKLQEYIATGEPDYVMKGREAVAEFEAEAERRGLL
ncbi:hypothetical protein [Nocardia salmonicida]|uniref:hypothetical protein n=1 Tax=Nocardia salmonicida TaxID=53431 RepID=UPI0033E774AF